MNAVDANGCQNPHSAKEYSSCTGDRASWYDSDSSADRDDYEVDRYGSCAVMQAVEVKADSRKGRRVEDEEEKRVVASHLASSRA